jgi:predicted DsbA family dithiol-disulfide isomerase
VGLDVNKFNICLASGKYASKVQADYDSLYNSGVTIQNIGTPYNIIITKNGQKSSVPGALPYDQFKALIDQQLSTGQ